VGLSHKNLLHIKDLRADIENPHEVSDSAFSHGWQDLIYGNACGCSVRWRDPEVRKDKTLCAPAGDPVCRFAARPG
jgi:hypothetical protein